MSAPEEIVCASAVAFHAALGRAHGLHLYGNAVNPGDSVTLGGVTVIYRPPPPRDEAREAFYRWQMAAGIAYPTMAAQEAACESFLAGRASVKP